MTPRAARRGDYGTRLMVERLRRGLTQGAAAEHVGVSLSTWKRAEMRSSKPESVAAQRALDSFLGGV